MWLYKKLRAVKLLIDFPFLYSVGPLSQVMRKKPTCKSLGWIQTQYRPLHLNSCPAQQIYLLICILNVFFPTEYRAELGGSSLLFRPKGR